MSMRFILAAVAALASAPAWAADLPDRIVIHEAIRAENPCGDAHVLSRIVERFAWADRHTWHRGLLIDTVANGRPSGHPFPEPGLIRRDYCMADAAMTDGSGRTIFYAIEYGQAFATIGAWLGRGSYVDFCVLGLDPWRVHDEACRTVR